MSILDSFNSYDTGVRISDWDTPLAKVVEHNESFMLNDSQNIKYRFKWVSKLHVELGITNPNSSVEMREADNAAREMLRRHIFGTQINYVRDALLAVEYGDKDSVRKILQALLKSMEG